MSEEDVTRALVLASSSCKGIKVYLAGDGGTARESESGADLEVWFLGEAGATGFGWRVQSKRIYARRGAPCLYRDVGRRIGGKPENDRQIDRLIERAADAGLAPMYWLYNTSIEECICADASLHCGTANRCAHCHHMHHSFVETGLLVVTASEMRQTLDARRSSDLKVEETMSTAWHLRCMLGTTTLRLLGAETTTSTPPIDDLIGFLNGLPQTPPQNVSSFTGLRLDGQELPLDQYALPGQRIPQEIRRFVTGEDIDGGLDEYVAERELQGIIAIPVS